MLLLLQIVEHLRLIQIYHRAAGGAPEQVELLLLLGHLMILGQLSGQLLLLI